MEGSGGQDAAPPEAAPPEPGPIEDKVETLTDEVQGLADQAVNSVQALANHGFDTGEAAAGDMLRIVDVLLTKASSFQSAVTGGITGNEQLKEQAQAVPGGGPVELEFLKLSDQAQAAANTAIDSIQGLTDHAVDHAQEAAAPWLHLVDTLVTRISTLQSSVVATVSGKLGGSQ